MLQINSLTIRQRMLIGILLPTILIFCVAFVYITYRSSEKSLDAAFKLTDSYAKQAANSLKSELELDMGVARGLASAFADCKNVLPTSGDSYYKEIMKNTAVKYPNYIGVWNCFELGQVYDEWEGKSGRASTTFYKEGGVLLTKQDTYDIGGVKKYTGYHAVKKAKIEALMNPYWCVYGVSGDSVLETTVAVPIVENERFLGLAGLDVSLQRFTGLIKNIKPFEGSQAFVIANNGMLVTHPNPHSIGLDFNKVYPIDSRNQSVEEKISKGKEFSFRSTTFIEEGVEYYLSFTPINVGVSTTPWSLLIATPTKEIRHEAFNDLYIYFIVGGIGVLVLLFIILFISARITAPIKTIIQKLNNLSRGKIDESMIVEAKGKNEISLMVQALNKSIDALINKAEFAKLIGEGVYGIDFKLQSKEDVLGKSLLEMRDSLNKAQIEEYERKEQDDNRRWFNEGVAKFAGILRDNMNKSNDDLSYEIIKNIIFYLDAVQGTIFMLNENDPEDVFFEISAAYAYDRRKYLINKIYPGEGLIGMCAKEKESVHMVDLPDNYTTLGSGLGEARPNSILIVPLKLEDEVLGIIEIASFSEFKKLQIEFTEKIAEDIASTLSFVQMNERTHKLLADMRRQAEEMQAQEEEMRQNLEELQSTQEQLQRMKNEDEEKANEMVKAIEDNKDMLLDIIDRIPEKIFLKDSKGIFVIANSAVAKAHRLTVKQLIGTSDFDHFDEDIAKEYRMAELKILEKGEKVIFPAEVFKLPDGTERILKTIKMPFYIKTLNETGLLGVQFDITETVERDKLIDKLKKEIEKLQAKLKLFNSNKEWKY